MDRHHSRAKFNRTLESLRRFIRNEHPFGQPNCGYCLEFLTATQRIKDLSCGAHQWVSVPVTGIYLSNENRSRLYLIVCYSTGAIVIEGAENQQPAVSDMRERILVLRDQAPGTFPATGNVPNFDLSLNFVQISSPPSSASADSGPPLWR
jgi:hypothetical protein